MGLLSTIAAGSAAPLSEPTFNQRWLRGQVIAGRYVLEGKLGEGGMGEVHLALMLLAGGARRRVVLKRIHPRLATDKTFVTMFLDEARIASQLAHSGVVPVLDAVEHGEELFLVLEYVSGWDVSAVLDRVTQRNEKLPVGVCLYIAQSLASTLAYVHDATSVEGEPLNVVHRDLGPTNIVIAHDGTVRLLDFGIAKGASRATQTATHTLKGKFAYMAPEHARGKPVDRRTDLYALGLLMFEMLTGRRAIVAPNSLAEWDLACSPNHVPPSSERPDVAAFDAVVLSLLEVDRSRRPENGQRLLEALRGIRVLGCGTLDLQAYVQSVMGGSSRKIADDGMPFDATPMEPIAAVSQNLAPTTAITAKAPSSSQRIIAGSYPVDDDFENLATTKAPFREASDPGLETRVPFRDPNDAELHRPLQPIASSPLSSSSRVTVSSRRRLTLLAFAGAFVFAASAVGVVLATRSAAPLSPQRSSARRAAKAVTMGVIRIETTPPGAVLRIDGGTWAGRTPTHVPSPLDRERTITLSLADHVDQTVRATVGSAGSVDVRITLVRKPGRLFIRSVPDSAAVTVSGRLAGRTPIDIDGLPREPTVVLVSLDGHGPYETTVRLDQQAESWIRARLVPLRTTGVLVVESRPQARVTVDGRFIDRATPSTFELPAGRHTVVLEDSRQGLRARRSVVVRAGQTTRIDVRLRR